MLFEFFIATYILVKYKDSSLSKAFILFVYMLGVYQLTEFMICTSSMPLLWAKLGFITYTFLPAVGLFACLNKNRMRFAVLIVPVVISLFSIMLDGFVVEATCGTFFIFVNHFLFNQLNTIPMIAYIGYYAAYIALWSYLSYRKYQRYKNTDNVKKNINIWIMVGIPLILVVSLLLLFVFPAMSIILPSIYCQFAIAYSVLILIVYYLDSKKGKGIKSQ